MFTSTKCATLENNHQREFLLFFFLSFEITVFFFAQTMLTVENKHLWGWFSDERERLKVQSRRSPLAYAYVIEDINNMISLCFFLSIFTTYVLHLRFPAFSSSIWMGIFTMYYVVAFNMGIYFREKKNHSSHMRDYFKSE